MPMETSQILFAIALGIITLGVTGFAVYVAWSTMWSDRWYRHPARSKGDAE